MIFYHYSTEKYPELKSLSAQKGTPTKPEKAYGNSVSLFTTKVPLRIAKLYHGKHNFWKSGATLYEHEIEVLALPNNVHWVITETEMKTYLLYEKQKWYEGMPQSEIDTNKREIDEMEVKLGYVGQGRINLTRAITKHGLVNIDLRPYIRGAMVLHSKHPDDKILEKYAASVPHVMIYPGMKPIKVSKINTIKLD